LVAASVQTENLSTEFCEENRPPVKAGEVTCSAFNVPQSPAVRQSANPIAVLQLIPIICRHLFRYPCDLRLFVLLSGISVISLSLLLRYSLTDIFSPRKYQTFSNANMASFRCELGSGAFGQVYWAVHLASRTEGTVKGVTDSTRCAVLRSQVRVYDGVRGQAAFMPVLSAE
jgi:hypothetical protein